MPINYPEQGSVSNQRPIYAEGDEYRHSSGAVFKRVNGNWKLIRNPDGTEAS